MKQNEFDTFRDELLELERHFRGDVATLEDEVFDKADGKAAGNLSNSPVEDQAERGFDNCCDETTVGLIENSNARLREINAALERLDDGTFGLCEECGQNISIDRLQAAPFARQCIECARNAQQGKTIPRGNL